jgi:hypothetical protein
MLGVQLADVPNRLAEVSPKHPFHVGEGRGRVPGKAGHVLAVSVAHPQGEPFLQTPDADRFQDPIGTERVTGLAAAGHPDRRPGADMVRESFEPVSQVAKLQPWTQRIIRFR